MHELVSFPSGQVDYIYNSSPDVIKQQCSEKDVVFITDSNIIACYPQFFDNKKTITIPAGENTKTLQTIQTITEELVKLEATRKTWLIGVGGGVITDITGFVASIYMRGVSCGFIATTLLGMVDAAIGGKNGVNIGLHKNLAGTITQPGFIAFDTHFLTTLPGGEWSNGFAEVIKYACIFDAALFDELLQHDIHYYQQNEAALQSVIKRCTAWKNKTVISDENENGQRKLLNFGHTAAHAIENLYDIPHGKAVAIGMVIAATISETVTSLNPSATSQIKKIIQQYNLPVSYPIDTKKAMEILMMDKKRSGNHIDYILLDRLGAASIHPLSFDIIEKAITTCAL